MADEEGELYVGGEGAVRDAVAEEEGGGAAHGACADAGDGVWTGAGGEAEGEAVAGCGVGEY